MKIALVTAIAAFSLDEDMAPLTAALARAGVDAQVLAWDDDTVSWARFDAVLLRSPWDYTERLPEFLAWARRVIGADAPAQSADGDRAQYRQALPRGPGEGTHRHRAQRVRRARRQRRRRRWMPS